MHTNNKTQSVSSLSWLAALRSSRQTEFSIPPRHHQHHHLEVVVVLRWVNPGAVLGLVGKGECRGGSVRTKTLVRKWTRDLKATVDTHHWLFQGAFSTGRHRGGCCVAGATRRQLFASVQLPALKIYLREEPDVHSIKPECLGEHNKCCCITMVDEKGTPTTKTGTIPIKTRKQFPEQDLWGLREAVLPYQDVLFTDW